jgi:site-specific DNA-methyltransferase (adenine-specific)
MAQTDDSFPPLPCPEGADAYFASSDGRFVTYAGDCCELMPRLPEESFDLVFADPPYFLSNGGITCQAGKMVSVNKGKWDVSKGFKANYEFTRRWLTACRRLLKPHGSVWVSGTSHIIHIVGAVMDELGYKILNDITWQKPNPPPNLSCRYFVHATETVIWAGRDRRTKHKFNYQLMKRLNGGKQMQSVWTIKPPGRDEKVFGKHPTQKPVALLERIIAASSDEGDAVLDPFCGSGTTGIAAARLHRGFAGIDTEADYLRLGACRYVGVPQADDPSRLIELVRAEMEEEGVASAMAVRLCIARRQVAYYRQAAHLLGLLGRYEGQWQVTDKGAALLRADQPAAEGLLARQIAALPLVVCACRKTRRYRTRARRIQEVARLLERCTSLAGATCERRAQTLLAWAKWAGRRCAVPGRAQSIS